MAELQSARARVATWTFHHTGFDAVAPGVRRTYRLGRRAYRAARADPSTEHLHDWRKRYASGFSWWPPNSIRIADMILPA